MGNRERKTQEEMKWFKAADAMYILHCILYFHFPNPPQMYEQMHIGSSRFCYLLNNHGPNTEINSTLTLNVTHRSP